MFIPSVDSIPVENPDTTMLTLNNAICCTPVPNIFFFTLGEYFISFCNQNHGDENLYINKVISPVEMKKFYLTLLDQHGC